jgi:GntR family histidine utilization transcriptional repressor
MSAESASLHDRIIADIGGRIVSGEWPPGHRVPFEHELTEHYGCSRMTVNKALTQLAKAGLIERRKRSGSFVARPRSQAAVLEIHDIRIEVEALGLAYRYELLHRQVHEAGSAAATEAGFDGAPGLIELSCLHFAGSAPFCLEKRAISLATVPDAAEHSFAAEAPGSWLIGHVPWSEAEHTIRAEAADRQAARILGVPAGTACLVVERRTWTGGAPVTRVRLTYPGSSHAVVARFTPRG